MSLSSSNVFFEAFACKNEKVSIEWTDCGHDGGVIHLQLKDFACGNFYNVSKAGRKFREEAKVRQEKLLKEQAEKRLAKNLEFQKNQIKLFLKNNPEAAIEIYEETLKRLENEAS